MIDFASVHSLHFGDSRDGSSKTGTYLLLDLVLSRIGKGVKELDVAASLEHLRDQRQGMIKSKVTYNSRLEVGSSGLSCRHVGRS